MSLKSPRRHARFNASERERRKSVHEGKYYVRGEYYVRGGKDKGGLDRGEGPQPSIDAAIREVRRRLCISGSMLISLLIIYSRVELADGAKLIISLPPVAEIRANLLAGLPPRHRRVKRFFS